MMKFHLKSYPDALYQLFGSVSSEEINKIFEKALLTIQKSFSIPGYRKGKVPLDIIKKNNPPQILEIVSQAFMNEALSYLEVQNIRLYSEPKFNPLSGLNPDQAFLFSLVCEGYPRIIKSPNPAEEVVTCKEYIMDELFMELMMSKELNLFDTDAKSVEQFDLIEALIINEEYSEDSKKISLDSTNIPDLFKKNIGDQIELGFEHLGNHLQKFIGIINDKVKIKILSISRPKKWEAVSDVNISEKTSYKNKQEYRDYAEKHFTHVLKQYNDSEKSEALSKQLGAKITAEIPKSLWFHQLREIVSQKVEHGILRKDTPLQELEKNKEFLSEFTKIPEDARNKIAFAIWIEDLVVKENFIIEKQEFEYYCHMKAKNKNIATTKYINSLTTEDKKMIEMDMMREKMLSKLVDTLTFKFTEMIPLSTILYPSK